MQNNIKEIVSKLSLQQKASLCSGLNFWETKPIEQQNVPSVFVADGPHGLRKENNEDASVGMKASFPATAFPPAVNMASSWNINLVEQVGHTIAEECKAQNVDVILGPGTNIKRSPLCGRNFEYFAEDPFLNGKLCVAYINGVQKNGVGTSLKHFAVNNQEYLRMSINSMLDERALREIYLPAFESAVKLAQPTTIMCSYNRLNGTYLSDNKKMLTDILRTEWGFKGIVVSDWNATNDRVAGIIAGLDLEMPSSGGANDKLIVKAVENGSLKIEQLDKVVERVVSFAFEMANKRVANHCADYEQAHQIARKMAADSFVLLKNDNNILPLNKKETYAVIGDLAIKPRYQGAGSSRINPYKLVNFNTQLDSLKINYQFAAGYDSINNDTINQTAINEAVELAKNSKKTILFIGLTDAYEGEGYDRSHLSLPKNQLALLAELAKINKPTAIVLVGGSPVEMPWLNNFGALLNAYLPGEAFGEAICDVLFGDVCPSGKLAETYPIKLDDVFSSQYYRQGPRNVEHRESIFVGYRYFDTAKKDVLFPFGYGLSYTKFDYSNLKLSSEKIDDTQALTVTFDVTNTGNVAGAEVAQVYVKDVESTIFRPEKELKGFDKVFLKPSETKTISVTLDSRAFSFYNVNINDWQIESGDFQICIGKSSRDIVLSAKVNITSNCSAEIKNYKQTAPEYYDIANAKSISDKSFFAVYGNQPLIPNVSPKRGELDRNSTMGDMQCCIIGKIIKKVAPAIIKSQVPNADITTLMMMQISFLEMPMRALNGVTTGLLDNTAIDGFLAWANKKRLKGIGLIISGVFKSLGNIRRNSKQLKAQKKAAKKANNKK
ncbi:MAG: glycoside hydrolase family 3 C-terminal domain-containing protein [Clostridia bacterium]